MNKSVAELSVEGLAKEQLLLSLANNGWYFRLKTVKNKTYLCARKSKEEHSLGQYTNELKHITEKTTSKPKSTTTKKTTLQHPLQHQ